MSFSYDKDLLEKDSVTYRINPIEGPEDFEVGKDYRMTSDDLNRLYKCCETDPTALDLVDESYEVGLNTYKCFMDKYPFIGIQFTVKDKVIDTNDTLKIPHYKIRLLQIDNIVDFWSEDLEDWMQFRRDINETFYNLYSIEISWGKSEEFPSSIKLNTDDF